MGNLEELREAMDRVTAYQNFQPERFDRREANRRSISPVAWQHIHFLGHYAFRDKQHPIDLEAILAWVNLQ
jgi:hypothetical protein